MCVYAPAPHSLPSEKALQHDRLLEPMSQDFTVPAKLTGFPDGFVRECHIAYLEGDEHGVRLSSAQSSDFCTTNRKLWF
jgi:hypothetical protein